MKNSADNKKKNSLKDDQGPQDPNNLAFDAENSSFEFDVNDNDPDWDHPSDYNSVSPGAADDDSTYDSSNPFEGDEYSSIDQLEENDLKENNMRVEDERIVRVSKEDEEFSRNAEDDRDDLDDEGYPKNDQ